MRVREQFDLKLKTLKELILELGSNAEIAIEKALHALLNKDIQTALKVINDDVIADKLEEEINNLAIILIARQSPVAIDLRRIITALKISAEVERIADLAVNIAKASIRIGKEPHHIPLEPLYMMIEKVKPMLSRALQAYIEEDVMIARSVAAVDDEIDNLYANIIPGYMEYSNQYPNEMNQITQLLFVGRYIERIADHTTNISEEVVYLVKGIRFDLNQ
ncbi:phosphate signaling complex protein PhoU [Bacillus solimangrovi]|uniref:Phosphate-specific transport system accessory protein PhoU n=1 Tax=Bacillus solimangrovi TaxID=1305675 RepID=A0A1E5LFS2_9BACI|nr:phosphate signaling complex protein PhoU [Bacillus solimangrovi]OEH92913.1 phosphate transport system regulatory protein PhoU [Bacillus solimangrovi]